jgi:hypothetical protein
MPAGGVRIEGLNKKVRDLQELGLEVEDLKDAFSTIADEAAEVVTSYAPVGETGALAASIRGNRAKSKAVVRAGKAAVPYAGPINYGWLERNIEPAEYMQKGDQQMQPIAVRRLEEEIEQQARKRGLK